MKQPLSILYFLCTAFHLTIGTLKDIHARFAILQNAP